MLFLDYNRITNHNATYYTKLYSNHKQVSIFCLFVGAHTRTKYSTYILLFSFIPRPI